MLYIGIDPGKSGAIALLSDDNKIGNPYKVKSVMRMPIRNNNYDYHHLAWWIKQQIPVEPINQFLVSIIIEKIVPFGNMKSIQSVIENVHTILGICIGLGLHQQTLVKPTQWKKFFGITSDKQSSIDKAIELYPDAEKLITWKHKIINGKKSKQVYPDDNMAEAILIAEYARYHKFFIRS